MIRTPTDTFLLTVQPLQVAVGLVTSCVVTGMEASRLALMVLVTNMSPVLPSSVTSLLGSSFGIEVVRENRGWNADLQDKFIASGNISSNISGNNGRQIRVRRQLIDFPDDAIMGFYFKLVVPYWSFPKVCKCSLNARLKSFLLIFLFYVCTATETCHSFSRRQSATHTFQLSKATKHIPFIITYHFVTLLYSLMNVHLFECDILHFKTVVIIVPMRGWMNKEGSRVKEVGGVHDSLRPSRPASHEGRLPGWDHLRASRFPGTQETFTRHWTLFSLQPRPRSLLQVSIVRV